MLSIFRRLMKSEQGATAIEYGLIAGLIAVAIIVAVGDIGEKLKAFFVYINTQLGTPPT